MSKKESKSKLANTFQVNVNENTASQYLGYSKNDAGENLYLLTITLKEEKSQVKNLTLLFKVRRRRTNQTRS